MYFVNVCFVDISVSSVVQSNTGPAQLYVNSNGTGSSAAAKTSSSVSVSSDPDVAVASLQQDREALMQHAMTLTVEGGVVSIALGGVGTMLQVCVSLSLCVCMCVCVCSCVCMCVHVYVCVRARAPCDLCTRNRYCFV